MKRTGMTLEGLLEGHPLQFRLMAINSRLITP